MDNTQQGGYRANWEYSRIEQEVNNSSVHTFCSADASASAGKSALLKLYKTTIIQIADIFYIFYVFVFVLFVKDANMSQPRNTYLCIKKSISINQMFWF